MTQIVTPFLWLEKDAIGAARYYRSIFGEKNVEILGEDGLDNTPSGSVQIVTISLFGTNFRLMSAGKRGEFNDLISFEVQCSNQEEVDAYWNGLTADGGEPGRCGWCKDKFGVSWQIVPKQLGELMGGPDAEKSGRVMQAMLQMDKMIIADLEKVHRGE